MSDTNHWHVLEPANAKFHGEEAVLAEVERRVAPDDGMYKGHDAYYLEVGANALHLIRLALEAGDRSTDQIERVLDYACGWGRVLRWLRAAFPSARIAGADANKKAIVAMKEIFDVDAFILDKSLEEDIGRDFDLIWMGSLATHLPPEQFQALLVRLCSLLSARGIVVATTHGPYVANRIASGEKTYGLDAAGMSKIIGEYETTGFGFSPYPQAKAYGISLCKPSKLLSIIANAALHPIFYQERAWMRHQDCFAAEKRVNATALELK